MESRDEQRDHDDELKASAGPTTGQRVGAKPCRCHRSREIAINGGQRDSIGVRLLDSESIDFDRTSRATPSQLDDVWRPPVRARLWFEITAKNVTVAPGAGPESECRDYEMTSSNFPN